MDREFRAINAFDPEIIQLKSTQHVISCIWKRQNTAAITTVAYYRANYSFNEFLSLRELPAFANPQVVTHANGMLNFAVIKASSRDEALLMARKLSKDWSLKNFRSGAI